MAGVPQRLYQVLESRLGEDLARSEGLAEGVYLALSGWEYYSRDIWPFRQRLENLLLQECYTRLGKKMRYRTLQGGIVQVTMEGISDLSDLCLALVLPGTPISRHAYPILRDLAFSEGSYAALLTLYLRYPDLLGDTDRDFIGMMLRNRILADRIPEALSPDHFQPLPLQGHAVSPDT